MGSRHLQLAITPVHRAPAGPCCMAQECGKQGDKGEHRQHRCHACCMSAGRRRQQLQRPVGIMHRESCLHQQRRPAWPALPKRARRGGKQAAAAIGHDELGGPALGAARQAQDHDCVDGNLHPIASGRNPLQVIVADLRVPLFP